MNWTTAHIEEAETESTDEISLDLYSEKPMVTAGVVIGTLTGLDEAGRPLVDFAGNPSTVPIPARATVAVGTKDVGRQACLAFERGSAYLPILTGLLVAPRRAPVTADLDGERLVLEADREIVLKCGKASMTLTRAGKVLIRGSYVLTRASGVNKIKGGAVHIN